MGITAFLLAAFITSAVAAEASASDLPKIDRRLVKEPKYAHVPKYFLLLFGPEARTRVWCVFDGDKTLYVDRNGNGDLTEDGERFTLNEEAAQFQVGDLTESDRRTTHRHLRIRPPSPWRKGIDIVTIEVEIKGQYDMFTAISVDDAVAKAMARPQDAPVRHFHGPLSVQLVDKDEVKLVRGQELKKLAVAIGTFYREPQKWVVDPGVFVGHYKGVPNDIRPVAEIAYPANGPGGKPVTVKVPLTQRFCSNQFYDPVRVPAEVGVGKAKITFSFHGWTAEAVAPTSYEVRVVDPDSEKRD
jgi:hypothetical protein